MFQLTGTNKRSGDSEVTVKSQHSLILFPLLQIGMTSNTASARDLFAHQDLGHFTRFFSAKVNPTGVVMAKLTPVQEAFIS